MREAITYSPFHTGRKARAVMRQSVNRYGPSNLDRAHAWRGVCQIHCVPAERLQTLNTGPRGGMPACVQRAAFTAVTSSK
jgi:hypothetical protein